MELFAKYAEDVQSLLLGSKVRVYKDRTHVFIYFKDLDDQLSSEVFDVMALEL